MGQMQAASAVNVNVVRNEADNTKPNRQNVTDQSLREMRDQGDQQFKAEHKKKPCVSYFIHKSDVHYENKVYRSEGEYNDKSKKAYINAEVFDKIEFRFGLPLIVFDFIDYVCGSKLIQEAQKYVNPQTHIERFDVQNQDFREVKEKVDETFLPNIFLLFNALGAIELKGENGLEKNATQEEKESKQHLTLASMKKNLHKVFGVKNDFLAQMLFLFISEHAPLDHKINYFQFMNRLKMFWPKKQATNAQEDPDRVWRERKERNERRADMRKFIYEFMQVSGG